MTSPNDPASVYTADQIDAILQGYYTQDDVDALLATMQAEIDALKNPTPPVVPPTAKGKGWGTGDPSAFKGEPLSAHRTYFGFNDFGANPKLMNAQLTQDKLLGRKSYVSIGSGSGHNSTIKDWPQSLDPAAGTFVSALKINPENTVLILHHEPENDPGTQAHFKGWFGIHSDYYRQQIPGLQIGCCLMAWTGRKGGPGFPAWAPDPSKYDVFCIDGYAHQNGDTAQGLFGNALAFAKSLKKPLAITEHGQEMWNDQSSWLKSIDTFVQSDPAIIDVMYWNGGQAKNAQSGHNYHLQPPGMATFHQILTSGRYAQGKPSV